MNRQEKEHLVQEIRDLLDGAQTVIVTQYEGLTVASMKELRTQMREANGGFRVIKNTLIKRATAETTMEGLHPHFVGAMGVAYSHEDPAGAAKVITNFAKDNDKLEVKAGWLEGGSILDADGVKALSNLPGRDELRSMLLSAMAGVPRSMVTVLSAPARDFVGVLAARQRQLEGGE